MKESEKECVDERQSWCCECCRSVMWVAVCYNVNPSCLCFSTERKEAESASLSAKEERFGRLRGGSEGRRRGSGHL